MAIKYLSVCSGIEAATVAWHPLGWEAVAYSEIEPFPCKVLAHHYPNTPNWGDMTKFKEWPDATIDALVGGTPCQSFSVAGLRQGLEDPRGELMLTYLAIAARYQPRWVVWENVPGVLSSNGGRDFGAFLGALGQLGYGWAYRVLDAQWFGVAQRRRRVFVVGCFGDWERAAKVLFESESVRRDTPSRRKSGEETARSSIPSVAGSLDTECGGGKLTHQSAANGHIVALQDVRAVNKAQNGRGWNDDGSAYTVDTHATQGVCVPSFWNGEQVTQTLDAVLAKGQTMPEKNRFPAVLVPDVARTLNARHDSSPCVDRGMDVVAFQPTLSFKPGQSEAAGGAFVTEEYAPTLQAVNNGSTAVPGVLTSMQVRRLTVTECERLQGFPDGYTDIPGAKDGPRYKALGNSMAVPCMKWIGERICN